jgi:hypothetical protein
MIEFSTDLGSQPSSAETDSGGLMRWLLAGSIALMPVQIETPFDIRFAPSDLMLVAAALLGMRSFRVGGPAWSLWQAALLGLLVASAMVKLLWTGEVSQYALVNKTAGLVLLLTSYGLVTTVTRRWQDVRWLAKVYVVSVTLQNTVFTAAFLWCRRASAREWWSDFLLSGDYDRLAGMLIDANAFGGLLMVAYAIVLLDGRTSAPLLGRGMRLASLLSLSLGLLLTSSRSAWIGLAAVTLYGMFRNPGLIVWIAVSVIGGSAAMAYLGGEDQWDQLLTLSSRQSTIEDRLQIAENAWQMFTEHPLVGGGIGAFTERHDVIVHNSAVWFLAEFGLIGLVVFLGLVSAFLFAGIAAYWRAGEENAGLIAGLIAAHLAMIGFSLGVEALYQRWWWLTMALIGSAYALATRDLEGDDAVSETGPLGAASDSFAWRGR